jgi:small-conductance mechanosensitive channel
MKRWPFILLFISSSLLLSGVCGVCSNGGLTEAQTSGEEAVKEYLVPIREVDDVFNARSEFYRLKALRAEAERAKDLVEKSYETYAKEADLERKRAEEIGQNLESLKTTLKTLVDKEAIRQAKEKLKDLQEQLDKAEDRQKLAVNNADLEIKNAQDIERKIKLLDDKIAEAKLRISYEIGDLYNKFAWKVVSFIALIIAVIIVRVVLLKLVDRYVRRDYQKYYYTKIIKVGSWIAVFLFITFFLMGKMEHFMLLVSFVGAGVAIALKDVITSFVAWFFIVGPAGFRVGDRIQLGDVAGDVVDVGLFRSTLMEIGKREKGEQAAGRIATFPNHLIFTGPLYNYTTGNEFLWNEISFLVTFESNWRRAEEIMLAIATEGSDRVIQKAERKMRSMSRKYMVRFGVLTPAVYVRVADSGVELTVRYLTDARMRRVTQDRMSRAILDEIHTAGDIDLAYPTIRYYTRGEESK